MKRQLYMILIGVGLMCACVACGNSNNAGGIENTVNSADANGENDNMTDDVSGKAVTGDAVGAAGENTGEAGDVASTAEEFTGAEKDADVEKDASGATGDVTDAKGDTAGTAPKIEDTDLGLDGSYVYVENPSEDYYCVESAASPGNDAVISLEMLTEETNDIIDTEKWFTDNGLDNIEMVRIEDEKYYYELDGDDGYSNYIINIYDKAGGELLKTLDFSDYRYAAQYKEEDYNYIEQRIWWVQSVDDVLYAAIGHNTYTESAPKNGYMVAVDLKDSSVIWKSAPCVTNARNFEIIGDTIVCGYGFTSEPDNLNLLKLSNGELVKQIPLKTMADYIIRKGDILYVRTYNTNYTFKIGK